MSKISYPQLVKNLADAYRTAIGSTEPIVIGELTAKVTEAMNSGGVSVEYKSITYNEDNTITLIDKDDIVHTMSCIFCLVHCTECCEEQNNQPNHQETHKEYNKTIQNLCHHS